MQRPALACQRVRLPYTTNYANSTARSPKTGVGHCQTLMWFKGESHMSEVFSFGSIDKTVSDQVSAFIKNHH